MNAHPRITASSWLMVGILGFTWGGTFLVTEIALTGLSPFWLASGRIGIAAMLMVVIWGLLGFRLFETRPGRGDWLALGAIGSLSSAIPFMLLAWGQQYVTSGFAGVSMAAVALIMLPMAHFLVPGERLSWRKGLGFIIGFIGVCVLIGSQAFETTGAGQEIPGRIACIGAAACYATSSILLRRLPAANAVGLAAVLVLIGACIVIPTAMIVEGPPPMPSRETIAVVIFLGVVPTAAANLLRVMVVRGAGPVFMSLTNYQVPLWSVLLGAAFLGEPLPPSLLLAMGLILLGLGLSQFGAMFRLFCRS